MVQSPRNLTSFHPELSGSDRRVVIASAQDLEGRSGASFQRLKAYAEALRSKDVEVYFTSIFFGLENFVELDDSLGNYIATNRVKNPPGKIATLIGDHFSFRSQWKYCKALKESLITESKRTSVLVYPSSFASVFIPIIFFRSLKQVRLIVEKNELAYAVYKNREIPGSGLSKLILQFINALNLLISRWNDASLKKSDGLICISTAMENKYKGKTDTLRIPILARPIQNFQKNRDTSETKNLCYTGVVVDNKDKLSVVLDALGILKKEGASFRFDIYGPSSKSSKNNLLKRIASNDLEKEVVYHGPVNGKRAMELQIQSDLLIALRSVNLQNTYGFSTKLAEYLHSGTPVLTTDVGDNAKYLSDGKNAFVLSAEDLSIKSVTRALREIIAMPLKKVQTVGDNGKKLAKESFSAEVYADELFQFFFL